MEGRGLVLQHVVNGVGEGGGGGGGNVENLFNLQSCSVL